MRRVRVRILLSWLALMLALLAVRLAYAQSDGWTVADSQAALSQTDPLTACVVRHEVPSLDPMAVGSLGELGLAQLAPFGELPHFERDGHTREEAFDPSVAVPWLQGQLDAGNLQPWSADRTCWGG